jgi:glycosyltransferase involved in cell wall biosynthesis
MDRIKAVHVYKSFNVYNGLIEILSILADTMDKDRYELIALVNEYSGNEFGEKFIKKGGRIEIVGNGSEFNKIATLHRRLKQLQPQIVQTHVLRANLIATLAARAADVPVIIATEMTLKNIAPPGVRRMRDRLLQIALHYSFQKCDKLVVTSEYLKKEWSPVWMHDKTEIMYPPFSIEKYTEAKEKKLTPKITGIFTIGFVGRLSEEKKVEDLIKAVKIISEKNQNIRCVIVGTGPEERQLKKLAGDLNVSRYIDFNGYSNNSFEILSAFDLFVLPSRTEGCPIVILEAMASGLPVIATDVGGNRELVVNNVTGRLIPPNNHSVLAREIIDLLEHADTLKSMGEMGKKQAFTTFEPIQFTKKLENLYSRLLKSHNIP